MTKSENCAFHAAWYASFGTYDDLKKGLFFSPGSHQTLSLFWRFTGLLNDCAVNLNRIVDDDMVERWDVTWGIVAEKAIINMDKLLRLSGHTDEDTYNPDFFGELSDDVINRYIEMDQ